eukprot:2304394-Pyramimonas_sp.AAC.2
MTSRCRATPRGSQSHHRGGNMPEGEPITSRGREYDLSLPAASSRLPSAFPPAPRQAAAVGLSHAAILRHIVASACHRQRIALPWAAAAAASRATAGAASSAEPIRRRQVVRVLFGGGTSERQVSLMSGTNVWLKLRESADLEVEPYLLAPYAEEGLAAGAGGVRDLRVWRLPYAVTARDAIGSPSRHIPSPAM